MLKLVEKGDDYEIFYIFCVEKWEFEMAKELKLYFKGDFLLWKDGELVQLWKHFQKNLE